MTAEVRLTFFLKVLLSCISLFQCITSQVSVDLHSLQFTVRFCILYLRPLKRILSADRTLRRYQFYEEKVRGLVTEFRRMDLQVGTFLSPDFNDGAFADMNISVISNRK